MTVTIRRPFLWFFVLLVAALVVTGYVVFRQWDRDTPAYHLQLAGTTWVVAGIGLFPAQEHETLMFSNTGRAVISTGCGTFEGVWSQDTDGGALGIDISSESGACEPTAAAYDKTLRVALIGVRSWVYIDDKHIELHGADVVSLVRP